MIIFIDSSGTENTIRNDDIAKDLFKRGNIKADTLVKTGIHGDWKRADSLELFSSLIGLKDEKDRSSLDVEETSTLEEEAIETPATSTESTNESEMPEEETFTENESQNEEDISASNADETPVAQEEEKKEVIESSVPSSESANESEISEEETFTENESLDNEKIEPEKKNNVKSFPVMTKENNIKIVKFFIYLCIGAGSITLIADIYSYNFLSSFKDPNFVYTEEIGGKADFHDSIISNIALFYIIIMIPAYFFGGRWIYRSNLNLQNISKINLRFSPGWSVGWYFIPIMSIWKPYQAMKEIYLTSAKAVNPNINNQLPGFFIIWWLLWILGNYLGWVYFRISMKAEELNEIIDLTLIGVGFDIVDIIATLLFLKIVMLINEMHKKIFNVG